MKLELEYKTWHAEMSCQKDKQWKKKIHLNGKVFTDTW